MATTGQSWIEKTPGVCGGDACIRSTRITVWGLVEYRQLGLSDAEILHRVVGLTPTDLEVAWAYHAQHRAEIDTALERNAEA
jgi:type III restriction enzyme